MNYKGAVGQGVLLLAERIVFSGFIVLDGGFQSAASIFVVRLFFTAHFADGRSYGASAILERGAQGHPSAAPAAAGHRGAQITVSQPEGLPAGRLVSEEMLIRGANEYCKHKLRPLLRHRHPEVLPIRVSGSQG